MSGFRLLGDLGATNVRFALLAPDGSVNRFENFRNLDYENVVEASWHALVDALAYGLRSG